MRAPKIKPLFTGLAVFLASITVMMLALAQESATLKLLTPKKHPALHYTNEFGKKTLFAPEKNSLTILHFWATWCEPCIEELPQIDRFQKRYAGDKVKVIALSMDNKSDGKTESFLERHSIANIRPSFDSDMSIFKAMRVGGLPTSIFINSKGQQIARADGPLDWESDEVKELVENAAK